MTEYIRAYWPIFAAIVSLAVTALLSDAHQSSRLDALEQRQDRQGTAIMALQSDVTGLSNDIAGMKATVESINNNVNFIRDRIVRVTQ